MPQIRYVLMGKLDSSSFFKEKLVHFFLLVDLAIQLGHWGPRVCSSLVLTINNISFTLTLKLSLFQVWERRARSSLGSLLLHKRPVAGSSLPEASSLTVPNMCKEWDYNDFVNKPWAASCNRKKLTCLFSSFAHFKIGVICLFIIEL